MKLATRILPFGAAVLPLFALAQTPNLGWFTTLLSSLDALVRAAIPIVIALAMLFFFWGVFVYFIYGAGDEEKRATGKSYMIYAIIGLLVIVSIWGIVGLLQSIFGIGGGATPITPGTPT